jgi:iron(II)-dependent oxidoreductase
MFYSSRFNSYEVNQTVRSTTPVGVYPAGVSPNHCWDMAGNVWEWTGSLWGKDWLEPEYRYPFDPADGREKLKAGDDVPWVLRGGSWGDYRDDARCSFRFRKNPYYKFDFFGFRVVVSPIF